MSFKDGDFVMPSAVRINNPRLNDHAQAIGYLCFMYNGLEANVNNLLGILAPLPDEELECFTNQFDLLKKLPTLKALAFKRKPSQLWFDDIELMSWAISAYIIPKRNRYVHDIWIAPAEGVIRRHERTRIDKPQSRQEPKLTTFEYIPTPPEEIWQLVGETRDVSNMLRHLSAAYRSGKAKDDPAGVFPQRYRDEWLARQKPPKESNSKGHYDPKP